LRALPALASITVLARRATNPITAGDAGVAARRGRDADTGGLRSRAATAARATCQIAEFAGTATFPEATDALFLLTGHPDGLAAGSLAADVASEVAAVVAIRSRTPDRENTPNASAADLVVTEGLAATSCFFAVTPRSFIPVVQGDLADVNRKLCCFDGALDFGEEDDCDLLRGLEDVAVDRSDRQTRELVEDLLAKLLDVSLE
jgi:hypothetical protein